MTRPPHTHRCTPGQASLPSVTTSPDRGSTQSWPLPTPPCVLLPPSAQGSPPDSTQMRAQEGSAHAKAWPCARVWAVSGSRGSKDTRGAWGTSCSPGCRGERGRWKGAESHGEGTRPHHAVINSSSVAVGRREVHDPTTGTWVGRDISGWGRVPGTGSEAGSGGVHGGGVVGTSHRRQSQRGVLSEGGATWGDRGEARAGQNEQRAPPRSRRS